MAELSVYIISISVLKQGLDIDRLIESKEKKQKFHLERVFSVGTDIEQDVVVVIAEISVTVNDENGNESVLQNVEVETSFKVKNLKTHVKDNDSEDLKEAVFKALVNLAYHHVRAIQAQQLNSTDLGNYLVPLLTITDENSVETISRSKKINKNIG